MEAKFVSNESSVPLIFLLAPQYCSEEPLETREVRETRRGG